MVIKEYIKKTGGKWCIYSHKTNKKLSCYPTEQEAKDASAGYNETACGCDEIIV